MKTLRPPKDASMHSGGSAEYSITCRNGECAAVMLCQRKDLSISADHDGSFASMVCPHCDAVTTLTVRALDALKAGQR